MFDEYEDDDRLEEFNNYHQKLDNEFQKLLIDPCMNIPEVGDLVIVAAGLLGMGHPWVREEAKILAIADTSYQIEFTKYKSYDNKIIIQWIHTALVTDIIKSTKG